MNENEKYKGLRLKLTEELRRKGIQAVSYTHLIDKR